MEPPALFGNLASAGAATEKQTKLKATQEPTQEECE
jgi:hypothetical protein